ncbi:MAG: S8 family serine peptidase [Phycisphaerales bacterium]
MHAIQILLAAAAATATAAATWTTFADRPVGPIIQWNADSLERFDPGWVHVKFDEGLNIRIDAAPTASGVHFVGGPRPAVAALNDLLEDVVTIRRTFPGPRAKYQQLKARGEAASGQEGPDLSLWFDVELPEDDRGQLAAMINALNAMDGLVEIAHPAPICETAGIMSPRAAEVFAESINHLSSNLLAGTPDFSDQQDYLYATPAGLNAPAAWGYLGGRGDNVKFIDVELGWTHDHEDFTASNFFHDNGNNSTSSGYHNHGTAVVGEVCAADNGYGVTGFASDAQWGTVGILIEEWPNVPHRFLEAAEALDPGDIWLIELQMFPSGRSATPMEYVQANYDVIWTSSWAMNVVCVEAGANGSQNLDDASWGGLFDRNVRDSGAIMVGAGTPTGRAAEGFSNYGSRMDAHAWGSAIVTTGYGGLHNGGSRQTQYTSTFGGTSGASPMVVGTGLCLQGIHKHNFEAPLTPADLRAIITTTGIPHLGDRLIGPRPDLAAAIERMRTIPMEVTSFSIPFGTHVSGGVDQLRESDDQYLVARSRFGFLSSQPNRCDVQVAVQGVCPRVWGKEEPPLLTIICEGRINNPNGMGTLLVRNWATDRFESVAGFDLGTADEEMRFEDIDSTDRILVDGDTLTVEFMTRVVVVATFSSSGFTLRKDKGGAMAVFVIDTE